MAANKRGDFAAVAADGHGAPSAAPGPGVIVEKKTASRVGATPDRGAGAFDQQLGGRTGDGGQEPIQAAFSCDKLKGPNVFLGDEFVMAFGYAEDFVDRLCPRSGEPPFIDNRTKDCAQGFAETEDAEKYSIDGLGLGGKKRAQPPGTILRNEFCVDQEGHEFIPGEIAGQWREIREVQGEPSGNKGSGARSHLTSKVLLAGYSKTVRKRKKSVFGPGRRSRKIALW
jgi:hypothetical protein